MKFTAFATILIGVLIAGYAGYQYASGGPSATSLGVSLAFAAALAFAGVAMWVFACGYAESEGTPTGPTRETGVLPADNVRHDPPRA